MRSIIYRFLAMTITVAALVTGCATEPPADDGFGKPALVTNYQEAQNLWTVLGHQFHLPDESEAEPAVQMQIRWFMTHPLYLQQLAESAKPYLYYIYQQVRARNLPAELTLLPMIESAYDPYAINQGSGAAGLWQMMPGTASGLGVRINWWYDGRRDVVASTRAALDYMNYLGRFFNDQWLISIAAYDSGQGTVMDAIEINRRANKPLDFWALPLSQETKNYVPKLLALATIIKYPQRYPVDLPVVLDAPYLAEVDVGSQIDLAQAAKMAGMSLQELSSLNPGFNRWATDPNGSHKLILPITQVERFETALHGTAQNARVSWYHYQVKAGDTLSSIAHHFDSTVALIQKVNHLTNNMIHLGESLLIPSQNSAVTQLVEQHQKQYFKLTHRVIDTPLVEHVVQPGETIWTISKRYHVSPQQLRAWNQMGTSNVLVPGTTLTVWPPKRKVWVKAQPLAAKTLTYAKSLPRSSVVLLPPKKKIKMFARGYLVMPGDTLTKISARFHVPVAKLISTNHLQDGQIHTGQALVIPA